MRTTFFACVLLAVASVLSAADTPAPEAPTFSLATPTVQKVGYVRGGFAIEWTGIITNNTAQPFRHAHLDVVFKDSDGSQTFYGVGREVSIEPYGRARAYGTATISKEADAATKATVWQVRMESDKPASK